MRSDSERLNHARNSYGLISPQKAAWEYTKRIADLHLQSMRNDQPVSLYERRSVNGIFTVRLFCRDSRPDAVRLSRLFRAVSHTAGENSPV
jgi:hypothetical protein